MLLTCISTANTKLMGENSTSIKVCKMIKDIVSENRDDINVDTLALVDYDIKPCILCGKCSESRSCVYDKDFNKIFSQILKSNRLIFVVPHYSPIPAKLIMIFEKINEIVYTDWLKNPESDFSLSKISVGIIGHGGMGEREEVLKHYHDNLITPVANSLKGLSFKVIGLNDEFPNGAPFGLKDNNCLRKVESSIFPEIVQDWALIKDRINPLINNVIEDLSI